MVTEFAWQHDGLEEEILMFYGVPPFGWGISPCHFCRFSDASTRPHQLHGPTKHLRNMPGAFISKMYIGDGLFIELEIGGRKEQSANKWEEIARMLLPAQSANEGKMR